MRLALKVEVKSPNLSLGRTASFSTLLQLWSAMQLTTESTQKLYVPVEHRVPSSFLAACLVCNNYVGMHGFIKGGMTKYYCMSTLNRIIYLSTPLLAWIMHSHWHLYYTVLDTVWSREEDLSSQQFSHDTPNWPHVNSLIITYTFQKYFWSHPIPWCNISCQFIVIVSG